MKHYVVFSTSFENEMFATVHQTADVREFMLENAKRAIDEDIEVLEDETGCSFETSPLEDLMLHGAEEDKLIRGLFEIDFEENTITVFDRTEDEENVEIKTVSIPKDGLRIFFKYIDADMTPSFEIVDEVNALAHIEKDYPVGDPDSDSEFESEYGIYVKNAFEPSDKTPSDESEIGIAMKKINDAAEHADYLINPLYLFNCLIVNDTVNVFKAPVGTQFSR